MSKELIKKNIDGHDYEFEQFGAKLALKTLTRLTRVIGEPLTMAVAGSKGGDFDPELLGKAVRCLSDKLDQDEVVSLVELLTAEKCLCDGKKIQFDTHYQGKLEHLFNVARAALEVQYGNFLGAVVGGGSQPPTK